ncbi:MAG: hypothetical protein IKP86_08605 [Anaerolineaceae bacterium]|nr:hypothetical protein [Anaerolineaceae bacterium]
MSEITRIAASLTLGQYLMLYGGCFVLAIIIACAGGKKSRSFRESLISLLALFGGMLAVGYVTVRLGKNPGLLILLILAGFSALIGFPAAMIAGRDDDGNNMKKEPADRRKTDAGREKKLMERAERLKITEISSISDDALLGAYVQLHRNSPALANPALKRIRDEDELVRIAKDSLADRPLRAYALDHIRSDEKLVELFRKYHGEWLGQEAYRRIKSQKTKYSLCQEFPEQYSCSSFSDPDILREILRNHMYPNDSMDPFPSSGISFKNDKKEVTHHKADLYITVLNTRDADLIGMLDKDDCRELTEACIKAVNTYHAKYALHVLKLIYQTGACESLNSVIESMHGKTFGYVNEINYYGERDYNPGFVFDLYGN